MKNLLLLVGVVPAIYALVSHQSWESPVFWSLNAVCSVCLALFLLEGTMRSRGAYIGMSLFVGLGFFFINAVIVFVTGCSHI